ncbi:ArdC family protein [Butyrivibrio sp. YAB3001]|uniref:ArdC family protein n=1 Tax=Butyrivibrio sp. YAB3001 TaxID=1520812 RepID=UPI0008F68137|nr:ArdC family protein [Butyrivibrio sp. YAB3001]SFC56297.1 protein of unknown function [Butyrivibrio sp. YAB3001]
MEEVKTKFKIDEITEKLEKGIGDLFNSDKYKAYLNTMSKFHSYSVNNTILIAMQRPDATLVAGYDAWQEKFDRHVKKGAKGIKIIAPVKVKKQIVVQGEHSYSDSGDKIPIYKPGETQEEYDKRMSQTTKEVEYTNFRVTTVFDVSDTEGKELPTLGVNELMGSVDGYEKLKMALEETSKVPVDYGLVTSGAKGFFSPEMHKICVQSGMSEVQTVKTIIHEMAHALLHDKTDDPEQMVNPKSKNTKEVEAESIAYVVCQHFGIDTSDYSFGYIAGWSSDKDTKELKASMEIIRKSASKMICDCECAMAKQQEAEKKDVAMVMAEANILVAGSEKMKLADDKKSSIMDKLKSKLNIVGSQQKVEKALENKVKTPELVR